MIFRVIVSFDVEADTNAEAEALVREDIISGLAPVFEESFAVDDSPEEE